MIPISNSFKRKVEEAVKKGWPHIVIAIDLHGVLVDTDVFNIALKEGAKMAQAIRESTHAQCVHILQYLTIRMDIKLFLYTSTTQKTKELIAKTYLDNYGIVFDYLNFNNLNLEPTRPAQDFSEKPYCDILLDAAAGFEPDGDWEDLGTVIKNYFIIPAKNGDS